MRDRTTLAVTGSLAMQVRRLARAEGLQPRDVVDTAVRECIRAFTQAPRSKPAVAGDGIFYRGPSLLTGDPIVGVLTGLSRETKNAKTGNVLQTWVLRGDMAPMDAVRQNRDDAICGDCALRGDRGHARRCYVAPWLAPNNIWRVVEREDYPPLSWAAVRQAVAGRSLRLGAYGDPAAIPFEIWNKLLATAIGWVGYTHQWRHCDRRFRSIVMASVDSVAEFEAARDAGWRTFRVLSPGESLLPRLEFVCPASDEGQHRSTCERCQLCRGQNRPARSVAIRAHGHDGVIAVFHRTRGVEHQ
jgi:hypothetical protein